MLISRIVDETIDNYVELGSGFWPDRLNMVQLNVAAHLRWRKARKMHNLAEGSPESLLIKGVRRIPGWHFTETVKKLRTFPDSQLLKQNIARTNERAEEGRQVRLSDSANHGQLLATKMRSVVAYAGDDNFSAFKQIDKRQIARHFMPTPNMRRRNRHFKQ